MNIIKVKRLVIFLGILLLIFPVSSYAGGRRRGRSSPAPATPKPVPPAPKPAPPAPKPAPPAPKPAPPAPKPPPSGKSGESSLPSSLFIVSLLTGGLIWKRRKKKQ